MPLNPGDILFVGWDSDNEDVAFINTVDLEEGEVIYFTDDEWDGTQFNGSEQLFEWVVPAGGIEQGTVITIDMENGPASATFSSGGAVDYIRGGGLLAQGNEMMWAFQGTRVGDDVTPTNFVAVIGNEDNGNFNQSPELSGTGLTTSNGAVIIDGDEDYMEWTGDTGLSDPVQRQDLIDSILDLSNWDTADGGGNNNPNGTGFDVDIQNVVCFASGSRLLTPRGSVPVENLNIGDLVQTLDGRSVPIRWIGQRKISGSEIYVSSRLRPVRITAGALAPGLPHRDLLVSRQHRILVSSKIARRMFGQDEVLVPAIKLTSLPGIFVDLSVAEVTYFHILCDRHEVVLAEGAPAETLLTGPEALKSVDDDARREIEELIFRQVLPDESPRTALPTPPLRQQKQLIARHRKNGVPPLSLYRPSARLN